MIIPISWNLNNAAQQKSDAITTLDSSADEVTLSENIRNFLFSPVETAPGTESKANAAISINGYIPVGTTITFAFEGFSIVLTASATPTSGEFFTEASVVPVTVVYLSAVAESIADALDQILSVRNSYDVNLLGGSIVGLEAKNFGEKFNITLSTSEPTLMLLVTTAGGDQYTSQEKIDYSAWARVYVGSEVFSSQVDKFNAIEVDFYTIDSAEIEANLNVGVVSDFVSPVLPRKKLTPANEYYLMDIGSNSGGAIVPNEDESGNVQLLLRPYFVVYGDSYRYAANQQKKRFVKGVTAVKWVQLGAFDYLRPYDMNNYIWIPNNPNSFKFLSSCPNFKEVTYKSHEYLQLICRKPTTNNVFNIELKCNFYDGTSIIIQKTAFQTLVTFGGSPGYIGGNMSFDVSPLALGLEAIETANSKLIDTYTVKMRWFSAGAVVGYSEAKTYQFNRSCNDKSNQIMFLNEFGAWDCIEFKGEFQSNSERNVSVINRVLPPNANKPGAINYNLSVNVETNTTENITIHSGLLSKEVYQWAAKLFDSSVIYLWNESLAEYESINIVDYDYGFDTIQGGGSISLTYNRTQNNTISQ